MQTDAGIIAILQESKRVVVAEAQAKLRRRGASREDSKREEIFGIFDSFDLDGSGSIDVRLSSRDGLAPSSNV